jgi:hypothetical protein
MPARVSKVSGGYSVRTPSGVKAKRTTKKKAEAQVRLLNAIDHGYDPEMAESKPKKKGRKPSRKPY